MRIVPEIMQLNIRQVQVENLDGIPLLGIGAHRSFSRANQLLKRSLDLILVISLDFRFGRPSACWLRWR